MTERIITLFEGVGGEFVTPIEQLDEKLRKIKAYIFDWDGVFNHGLKQKTVKSGFHEPDSHGTNLLRFGYWRNNQKTFPVMCILTGSSNDMPIYFGEREHFECIYRKYSDKTKALKHFMDKFDLEKDEIAYVFDDTFDLALAKEIGVRFLIQRAGSPAFTDYVRRKKMADYISGNTGGKFGLREVCELVLEIQGIFDETIENRYLFTESYQAYLAERNKIQVAFF